VDIWFGESMNGWMWFGESMDGWIGGLVSLWMGVRVGKLGWVGGSNGVETAWMDGWMGRWTCQK
jgi:hypothetical protein